MLSGCCTICSWGSLRLFNLFGLAFLFLSSVLTLATNTLAMDLIVVPGANIGVDATTEVFTAALATQERWNLLNRQELFQRWKESATDNFDFSSCLLIKEALDHGPDTAEKHGCVYNKQVAHDFGVVVGTNLRG